MKSVIRTFFTKPSKVQDELSAICEEYADICQKQRETEDRRELIRLEKTRLRLQTRMSILNFRAGSMPCD